MAVKNAREGMSTIVTIFLILAVALVGISWFQANVLTGKETQRDLLTQFGVDDTDYRLQSSLLYLQTGFGMAGTNGTWKSANMSGREDKEHRYRYWYCKDSPQVPSVDVVRNTTSYYAAKDLKGRINELHGVRDNNIYRVGELQCVETGYRTPMDVPRNDHFDMAFSLANMTITTRDGTITREKSNFSLNDRIIYDRYWYMYSILKRWMEEENKKDRVRREVQKQVNDRKALEKVMCLRPGERCKYPGPPFNCVKHCAWVQSAVADGLRQEMQKLEENSKYFDRNDVQCAVTYNNKDDYTYPGVEIIPKVKKIKRPISPCACSDQDGDGDIERPEECEGTKYRCITTWRLYFKIKLDYTVQCTDNKFISVPRKELVPLQWKTDVSYRVNTFGNGQEYFCEQRQQPVESCRPFSLRACSVNEEANLCETGIDTVKKLPPKEGEDEG